MHERFGHDVHIDGDLVQTATGLALTVRGDGVPARTFAGTSDQLSLLVAAASEYIYGSSQPWLFSIYLASNNRSADALHFLPDAFRRATTDEQRADLANVWGVALADLDQLAPAVAKLRLAMSLVPPRSQIWWKAWGNIIGALNAVPSAREAQWQESSKFLGAVEQAPEDQRPEVRLLADAASATWDLPLLRKALLQDASRNGGAGSLSSIVAPQLANVSALMHEPESAERWIAASDPGDPLTETETAQLIVYTALARGDPSGAIAPAHTVFDAWLAHPQKQFAPDGQCFLGLAEGLAGDTARAETDFARAGAWPRCFAFHGDVLAHSGDVAGALRKWADGLRLAPDQMLIYLHRGLFELSSGDTLAALADFAAASARAPHYADPLKAWGDTLARVGRWREALAKYDAAIAYAPAWRELRQARAAAVKRA